MVRLHPQNETQLYIVMNILHLHLFPSPPNSVLVSTFSSYLNSSCFNNAKYLLSFSFCPFTWFIAILWYISHFRVLSIIYTHTLPLDLFFCLTLCLLQTYRFTKYDTHEWDSPNKSLLNPSASESAIKSIFDNHSGLARFFALHLTGAEKDSFQLRGSSGRASTTKQFLSCQSLHDWREYWIISNEFVEIEKRTPHSQQVAE